MLDIFHKEDKPSHFIFDMMNELEKDHSKWNSKVQSEDDLEFFKNAMKVAFTINNLELGYRIHNLNMDSGRKFMSNSSINVVYYVKLTQLIARNEGIDATMSFLNLTVPKAFCPGVQIYLELMKLVQTSLAYHYLPSLWEMMKFSRVGGVGRIKKMEVMVEFLEILEQVRI